MAGQHRQFAVRLTEAEMTVTRGLAKRRCREHRPCRRRANVGPPRLSTTTALALKTSTASLLALALQTLHNSRPSIRLLVRRTNR